LACCDFNDKIQLLLANMAESMIARDTPLIDLHRHIDGNVRLTTILDWGQRN